VTGAPPVDVTAITIGAADNGTPGTSEWFIGLVDELRVYDRILGPAEIATL
jgi:hypothetical protein